MTAKEFLVSKGIKDTIYIPDANPDLPGSWRRGGLSKLLDEYADSIHDEGLWADKMSGINDDRRQFENDVYSLSQKLRQKSWAEGYSEGLVDCAISAEEQLTKKI